MNKRHPRPIRLALALVVGGLVPACAADEACESANVSAQVTRGRDAEASGRPVTEFPFKVVVRVDSNVVVNAVTVGSSAAQLTNATTSEWTADLFKADLEEDRDGDAAVLPVAVTSTCNATPQVFETVRVPIGPSPQALVTDLALDPVYPIADACALPADQSAQVLVRVTASEGSAGAKVTLGASQGTFVGGQATAELTLRREAGTAVAESYFLPARAGVAVLTAQGNGDTAEPKSVLTLAPPQVTGPTFGLPRGTAHNVTARSSGAILRCSVDGVVEGAVATTILRPALGALTDEVTVPLATGATRCTPSSVRLQLTFGADAPNGSAVTIRCVDALNQVGSATFTVANAP